MPTAYITAPPDEADSIARSLVEARLAACVNQVECHSTYRWDDEIHDDEEVILLAKTTETKYPELVDHVEQVHPHDVPCIERFDESHVFGPFERWRADATGP